LPGVKRLVSHLKKHNIPIAVATSSRKHAFDLKSSQHTDLFDLFDAIITGDDPAIRNGKPAPDIFIEAAKRLKYSGDSKSILVFEDAPSGVRAGLNANMRVVWVPDTNLEKDQELVNRVDIVLASLESFKPEAFGLPPFTDD